MNHGDAVEADLYPDVDLLDLYDPERPLDLRRVWVLVQGRLLIEAGDGAFKTRPATALARSIGGELGDWTRLELLVGSALGAKLPESKSERLWKAAQQKRVKERREARQREIEEAEA